MKLEDIIKAATVPPIEYVEREITWNGHKFKVKIKSAETPADFEHIYMNGRKDGDAISARRVHRYVLFDGERMPYEDALNLKFSFLEALCIAINDVHGVAGAAIKKH